MKNANAGYAMSKFALVALTHAVRRAGRESGVRAAALCPGFVATDMTLAAPFPRERMSDPRDVAMLVEAVLRLSNTASVAELLVNCQLEEMLNAPILQFTPQRRVNRPTRSTANG